MGSLVLRRMSRVSLSKTVYSLPLDSQFIVRHDLWMRRPLPKNYAAYAATDAQMIHALYELFTKKSFITPDLPAQSMRYITICKDHQPTATDVHVRHPLLPLDILEVQVGATARSVMRTCDMCRRPLSEKCFAKGLEGGSISSSGNQSSICWICRAVTVKNENRNRFGTRGRG